MHGAQGFERSAVCTKRHHAQYGGLCAVVAVLRTTFALGYPNVVGTCGYDVVHVATHQLARKEQLFGRKRSPHDEGFVHSHKALNPGVDEQVVADGDLHRVGKLMVDEHHRKDGRVEHNVSMVGDVGVAGRTCG